MVNRALHGVCMVVLLVGVGCRMLPQQPLVPSHLNAVQPPSTESVRTLNTVVLDYAWKKQSVLMYLEVNQTKRTYTLAAMTQLGVKLLELRGSPGKTECLFALDRIAKYPRLIKQMGRMIERIYFDVEPEPPFSEIRAKDSLYVQTQCTRYTYAGTPLRLRHKMGLSASGRPEWNIEYREYRDAHIIPSAIRYQSRGFQVEIRLKKWL